MSWTVTTPDGLVVNSDDFTLEEADAVEKLAGEPWILMNPVRTISAARAFIAIGWVREGLSADEITARLGRLTVSDIKGAFEFVPDAEAVKADPKGKAESRPESGTTPKRGSNLARPTTDGRPPLRAANG